jgi:hypothetical protein
MASATCRSRADNLKKGLSRGKQIQSFAKRLPRYQVTDNMKYLMDQAQLEWDSANT